MTHINRFNVRAYGLLIEDGQLLLAEEFKVMKFPGGGLEYGEGTHDCIIREFKEETGMAVRVKSHFYTTDFFQQSAFKETDQVISIYYLVEYIGAAEILTIPEAEQPEGLNLHWVKLSELTTDTVQLPIDKLVVKMLLETDLSKI